MTIEEESYETALDLEAFPDTMRGLTLNDIEAEDDYSRLQDWAQALDIKANQSKGDLRDAIVDEVTR